MKNILLRIGKVSVVLTSATVLALAAACGSMIESIPSFCDGKQSVVVDKYRDTDARQKERGLMYMLATSCSEQDNRGWGTVSWSEQVGPDEWNQYAVGSNYP